MWQLGSNQPNFTLEGHEKGVNCVDYYSGGDKPYLISGADDRLVKIWDYQNKTCVQTLDGHSQNVTAVCYHPEKPIIMSGSEDGSLRIWHSNTYRLEDTLTYNLERVWCVQAMKGSNSVAIGYDEGTILIKMGKDEPAVTMDAKGKIIWSRNSELCHVRNRSQKEQIIFHFRRHLYKASTSAQCAMESESSSLSKTEARLRSSHKPFSTTPMVDSSSHAETASTLSTLQWL